MQSTLQSIFYCTGSSQKQFHLYRINSVVEDTKILQWSLKLKDRHRIISLNIHLLKISFNKINSLSYSYSLFFRRELLLKVHSYHLLSSFYPFLPTISITHKCTRTSEYLSENKMQSFPKSPCTWADRLTHSQT